MSPANWRREKTENEGGEISATTFFLSVPSGFFVCTYLPFPSILRLTLRTGICQKLMNLHEGKRFETGILANLCRRGKKSKKF